MKADRRSAARCDIRFDYAQACCCVLLAAGACRTAPTQTNLLLDVEVAQPLTSQVDRVGVYGEPWQSKADPASEKSSSAVAMRNGNVPPFVLIPGPGKTELQALIIAWHDSQPIAWVVFRSSYAAGSDRFLKIKLGCSGPHDLGMQSGDSDPATTAIDACKFSGPASEPGADSPNDEGVAGSAGAADGGAGSSAGASGAAGSSGHAADGGAGTAGDADASVDVAGASGSALGAGGAGSGGSTVAGAGGTAGSAAGAGSGSAGDCYKWVAVDIASPPDMASVMPGLKAGTDMRASDPPENVPNYVCLGTSRTLSGTQVGKASQWGCYVPGSGTTEDTDASFQLLEAPADNSCLVWRPLDATSSAQPNNLKYLGMPLPTPICRVEHDAVGAGASSTGKRVGQLRQENGVWVCRFEFYFADNNMTFVNDANQVPEVLDLAP